MRDPDELPTGSNEPERPRGEPTHLRAVPGGTGLGRKNVPRLTRLLAAPLLRKAPAALASGALIVAAFPGIGLWGLAFVQWVPLLVVTRSCTASVAGILGWLCGTVAHLLGFAWLPDGTCKRRIGDEWPRGRSGKRDRGSRVSDWGRRGR